jgi:hypothetical protein
VSALELEGNHRTEGALLALGELVPGMLCQPRIPHAAHVVLSLEPRREGRGVAGVVLEARVQRAQSAQGEKAVERCAGDTEAVGPPGHLLMHRGVARDHRAADHVAVPVQVLGGRVDNEVRAERQRLLPGRRQESIVDHDQGAGGVRLGGDGRDVGDAQQRVARRLDPHHCRRLRQRRRDRGLIAEVDEVDPPLAAAPPGVKQPVGATVTVVRHDDARTCRHQIPGDRDRGHAARGDHCTSALLELGQGAAQQIARRIAGARVVVSALLAEGAERKCRSEMQRRYDAAAGIVAFDAGAHGLGDLADAAVDCRWPGARGLGHFAHWKLRLGRDPVSPDSCGAHLP